MGWWGRLFFVWKAMCECEKLGVLFDFGIRVIYDKNVNYKDDGVLYTKTRSGRRYKLRQVAQKEQDKWEDAWVEVKEKEMEENTEMTCTSNIRCGVSAVFDPALTVANAKPMSAPVHHNRLTRSFRLHLPLLFPLSLPPNKRSLKSHNLTKHADMGEAQLLLLEKLIRQQEDMDKLRVQVTDMRKRALVEMEKFGVCLFLSCTCVLSCSYSPYLSTSTSSSLFSSSSFSPSQSPAATPAPVSQKAATGGVASLTTPAQPCTTVRGRGRSTTQSSRHHSQSPKRKG